MAVITTIKMWFVTVEMYSSEHCLVFFLTWVKLYNKMYQAIEITSYHELQSAINKMQEKNGNNNKAGEWHPFS